ncbi:MAG: type II secretion system F family protein [Nitrosomonas sp.]|uniref:type II secretion system F family protein n=1 Tax=Nitrosomonas sp. TaxID=42353 RepID=UPI00272F9199|nr:type II secretion system F family protein [Nitrosomonas sp.]MDP1549288.1 type II secretion system F family protein [Nitrosomonas sp.]
MTMIQMIYLVIIFITVSGVAFILIWLLIPRTTQARLDQIASENAGITKTGLDQWEQSINRLTSPFATLSLPSEGWENSLLRIRFMHAGYRSKSVPYFYFGGKTILALILPAFFFIFVVISRLELGTNSLVFFFLALSSLGYYLPNIILARMIALRQRDLFENVPDALDLMTVCVEAGLGMDAAMNKVGEEMYVKCRPLAEELHLVNLEMRAGRNREDALRNLALRTGVEEIEGLVAMLVQADRFGTSIAASLRVHSDMLRTKRRLRAEEAAAKIALKLLFPLIFFIFPSLLLVLLGPAMIQVYRVLLPTMTGVS